MFIVKIPRINSKNGETKGCEKAGNAIIESLKEVRSNSQGRFVDARLLDLEEIHLDNSDPINSNKLIYENALEIFGGKTKTIFLGGDHSMTFSLGKAFLEYCRNEGKEPCLIIFDAHADCSRPEDLSDPGNKEWIYALIEKGFLAQNILIAGARNNSMQEAEFLSKQRIRTIKIDQFLENIEEACDTIMEFSNGKELYLSIDINFIDPAFAPATKEPEPGGLNPLQFLHIIQRLNRMKNLRAADLAEINTERQGSKETIRLGSRIISEFL